MAARLRGPSRGRGPAAPALVLVTVGLRAVLSRAAGSAVVVIICLLLGRFAVCLSSLGSFVHIFISLSGFRCGLCVWVTVLHRIRARHIFLPICGSSSHSLNSAFWGTEVSMSGSPASVPSRIVPVVLYLKSHSQTQGHEWLPHVVFGEVCSFPGYV